MTVTKVLQEQSGIQYGGPQDKSEADPRDSLLNTILAGQFKRGRLDKPFKVTKANYRAKLGHDPANPDYVAVEDALADGAPYVWVQRIQKGGNAGSMTSIDTSDLNYPTANAFVAFTVPSSTHRFSVNVDGDDITGTLADVMGKLADEYGILTTYANENQVFFTIADTPLATRPGGFVIRGEEYQIAITGVSPAPKDDTNYLLNDATNRWQHEQYCEVLSQPNNVFTFSLQSKRMGAWMPAMAPLTLDSTLKVKVSYTAKSIDLNDYNLTSIPLTNWINGMYEKITVDTPVQFFNPDETRTAGYAIANKDTDIRYAHFHKVVGYQTMMKAINDVIDGSDSTIDTGPFSYSSNTHVVFSEPSMYLDFSEETQYRPFLKGYVPYLEVGM